MKAKLKSTGEIFEVINLFDDGTAELPDHSYIKLSNLQFFDLIDWEQRRYEIAKDMMAVLAFLNNSTFGMCSDSIETQVKNAIICADELIKQLKGK